MKNKEAIEIATIFHKWINDSTLRKSPNTVKAYTETMSVFLKYLEDIKSVTLYSFCIGKDLAICNITEWLNWMHNVKGCKPESCNARLASLRAFFKYLGLMEPKYRHLYMESANITRLKEKTAALIKGAENEKKLIRELLVPGDVCVLVVPIDKAAPKGRLILPQQQTIRDVLEGGASAHICRETELKDTLGKLAREPRLVVTDSQVFGAVSRIVPADVPLTSFSILMARYKGDLGTVCRGAFTVDSIKDGDRILISEGCTHHRQCGDIGTEKLPAWIRKHTGANPQFEFTSGTEFPKDVTPYRMVIHCGGCTLREKEMKWRIGTCVSQGVPITNYGILIAHLNGILARATEMFPEVLAPEA